MIERNITPVLKKLADMYPVVAVTGPRQSGKTTLCRASFPEKPYVTLEALDEQEFANRDPRGFLARHRAGAILDEVQHAPGLLSYLQGEVDERPEPGRFVLTGSQHFGLSQVISQSLAGRVGMLELLPLSLNELRRFPKPPSTLDETLWAGAYPRIHDRGIPPDRWLADYLATYLQRDVRQLKNIGDLHVFTTFLRLCAGRTGQVLNLSSLGADCGVTHNTARSWLSVLETSYIVFRLAPWHRNLKKQLTRAPKLHFFDSGLACYLLGIGAPEQLARHPLRGALLESWVAAEVCKARFNRGRAANICYFRDHKGLEVDLLLEESGRVILTEVKAGATVAEDFFGPLRRIAQLVGERAPDLSVEARLIYGGEIEQRRREAVVVPWSGVSGLEWG